MSDVIVTCGFGWIMTDCVRSDWQLQVVLGRVDNGMWYVSLDSDILCGVVWIFAYYVVGWMVTGSVVSGGYWRMPWFRVDNDR